MLRFIHPSFCIPETICRGTKNDSFMFISTNFKLRNIFHDNWFY